MATSIDRDTQIHINPGPRVPQTPNLHLPTRTTDAEVPPPPARTDGAVVTTETRREVNWGGVVKGALIIGAVALAAVVAFTVAPIIVNSVLSAISGSPFLAGVVNTISSGISFVFDAVYFYGSSFFATLFSGGAAAGTAAGTAATVTPIVHGAAISQGAGYLAAGATAAIATPFAVQAVKAIPAVHTVQAHVVTPTLTGMEDGGASAHHGAVNQKSQAASQHATVAPSPDFSDMPDLPDEILSQHHANHHFKHAAKLAHHAETEAQRPAESPRAQNALRHTVQTSQAWADRVGGPREQEQRPAPRQGNFAAQLESDRAALDSALGENAR